MPLPPSYPGVYVQELPAAPHVITPAPTAVAAFVGRTPMGPLYAPQAVASFAEYTRLFGDLAPGFSLGLAVYDFFACGGAECFILRIASTQDRSDPTAVPPGDPSKHSGLDALDTVTSFNILCIPPDDPAQPDGGLPPGLWAQAAAYCVQRRAMLLVEPPASWLAHVRAGQLGAIHPSDTGITGTDARNAVVYFPRVLRPDPLHPETTITSSATGMIAGIWAATDAASGVWNSPAGMQAALPVSGCEIPLTDGDNATLNPLGINCLRTFPNFGTVLWGARTLAGADTSGDDFKYIAVRRFSLFLEDSLLNSLQWTVFEPNDEALWSSLRLTVTAFMTDLWQQGALTGSTAFSSFFVKCDSSTTTQTDISNGVCRLVVGFAPVKPAEFIVLQCALSAQPAASL